MRKILEWGNAGRQARWLAMGLTVAMSLLMGGCGGSDTPAPPPPAEGSATLGVDGGQVDGPDGVQLAVPPGALAGNVTFRIARDDAGAPALPAGTQVLGSVYAISPHGENFDVPASVRLPVDAAALAGREAFLMKAQPGGRWTVLGPVTAGAATAQQGVASLSYFAVGVCTNNLSPGVVFGEVCPTTSALKLEILDGSGIAIPVSQDQTFGAPQPVMIIREPTTLTLRLTWTRPAGSTRVDSLEVGNINNAGMLSRGGGFTFAAEAPHNLDVIAPLVRTFTVRVDPASVSGAGNPNGNGTVRNLWAQARYQWHDPNFFAFGADWEFNVFLPVRVIFSGTQPVITSGPLPQSVSVVENTSFNLQAQATGNALSFQWRYFTSVNDATGAPAEGVNNQASYTSPPAPLAWNGRLYYVRVCSSTGSPAVTACVDSPASPLTVTAFTERAVFTTHPASQGVLEGETVDFSAVARGTPSPAYSWVLNRTCDNSLGIPICRGDTLTDGVKSGGPLNGATVSGAATGQLRLAGVSLAADGATLTALASQPGQPGVSSNAATLRVSARPVAPSITQPLVSQTVNENGSATFTVGLSGTEPITPAWTLNGTPLANSGNGTVTIGNCTFTVDLPDANKRRLVLSSISLGCNGALVAVSATSPAGGPATSQATLNVNALPVAPSVGTQPANVAIDEGQRASFTFSYSGTLPMTIKLQRLTGGNYVDESSTDSTACPSPCTLNTAVLQAGDNGANYRVLLVNVASVAGVASNAATVTVRMVRLPVFTRHPASAAVDANQATPAGTASFDFALGADSGSFSWQWLLNGTPLADGSNVAGNGALAGATVSGATGTLAGAVTPLVLSQVPQAANGVQLSVRVTRNVNGQTTTATSQAATLTVNVVAGPNDLTALQVVAGGDWSMALRPDRTVWGWGSMHSINGTVVPSNLLPADRAKRPVQMYPALLTDIQQIAGWSDSFWALKGVPGTVGSRVLHWGNAVNGADGRGSDGAGTPATAQVPVPGRRNNAQPVEVLERVNNVAQPVDRVCQIAGGASRLLLIRAINAAGQTTTCAPGAAKTVWHVGSLTKIESQSPGVVQLLPGIPVNSPPATVFLGQTGSGSPGFAIALEDGRAYGFGSNFYNGYGWPVFNNTTDWLGDAAGPWALPATWGAAKSFGMSFYYSLFVVRQDGTVATSGYNGNDELGLGPVGLATRWDGPLPLVADTCNSLPCASKLAGVSAIVSTDNLATLALQNGKVLGWGPGQSQLVGEAAYLAGVRVSYPTAVAGLPAGMSAISAARSHALAIGPGGVVWAWGAYSQGATGSQDFDNHPVPFKVQR